MAGRDASQTCPVPSPFAKAFWSGSRGDPPQLPLVDLDTSQVRFAAEGGSGNLNDKVTILTNFFDGDPIADIDELTYWTYRDGTSTSPDFTVPSINIFITNAGPDGDVPWAPLVWEPIYPFGADAITDDEWQEWDTMAETETNFAGGWWSTRDLGSICAFNCFVSWETVLEQNPHATIIVAPEGAGSVGLNLGTGPAGSFTGSADAFSLTMDGFEVIFDFELTAPSEIRKDTCKDGGWEDLGFRNQGQCVRWVNTGQDSR